MKERHVQNQNKLLTQTNNVVAGDVCPVTNSSRQILNSYLVVEFLSVEASVQIYTCLFVKHAGNGRSQCTLILRQYLKTLCLFMLMIVFTVDLSLNVKLCFPV